MPSSTLVWYRWPMFKDRSFALVEEKHHVASQTLANYQTVGFEVYRAVLTRRCSVHRADQTSLKNDKRTYILCESFCSANEGCSARLKAGFGSASPGQPNSHGLHWAMSAPGQEQDDLKIDSFWVFSTDHFRDRKNFCEGSLQGYSVPCPIFDAKQRFGWWRYIPSSSSQKSPELVQDVLAVWDNLEQKLFSNMM